MSKQCTKPKRKRDKAWFKDKVILIALMANLSHYESNNLAETELSAEQAFWSQYSVNSEEPNLSSSTTIVEVPKELPKVSMVNSSLKNLKFHLASFDVVVKERTTATTITEGTWGFKHTKACFTDEIIPFVKALKDLFNSFDQFLIDELTEVQNVFNQIKHVVEQHCVEKNKFHEKINNVLKENDRLLEQAISVDIVYIVVHANMNTDSKTVNESQSQEKDTVIMKLKERIKSLSGNVKEEKIKRELEEIETINIELDHRMTKLVAENEHLKQTYKQLYDSIKSLPLKETSSKLKGKVIVNEVVTLHPIDPELLKIDVAPLDPKLRNNRIAHTDYLRHTQEETATLREIVESERLLNPLNTSLNYACKYIKHNQELLIILKQSCPCINDLGTKLMVVTPKNNNKKFRFTEHIPSSGNTPVKTTYSTNIVSNTHVLYSTGVNLLSSASGSQPQGNTKKDRIQRTPCKAKKNKLEDYPRTVRPSLNKKKRVVDTKAILSVPTSKLNVNDDLKCATCKGCLFSNNHDSCVLVCINSVNTRTKSKSVKKPVVQIILWYLDSGCSKHMIGDRSQLINFVHKFLGTVNFGNAHVAKIMGYDDYKIGNVTISRVYFMEGLEHNLFSMGQFCDSDLEVTFRQRTCFICNLYGVDLLTGSQGNNLYSLSLQDMMASSPIFLLSKASKNKSWLWHRRLSHMNFGAINHLARQGLVRGLPKLKFEKDHLCSACVMGKSKKKSHKPKSEDTNQEKLYLLHMDLYGPMRVESVNGKKYILVIVDDYSRFTWVKFLRSKDEAQDFIIKFLKMIQVRLKVSKNDVVERRNRTLIEATRTMLIYAQASLFLWVKVMATACYTQNRSIIRLRHGKTPYELMHNKLPDLSFLHVFGALCYPSNDSENLGKLQPKADIGIFIGYASIKKLFEFTTDVQDELLKPSIVNHQAPEVIASIDDVIPPVQAESTGSPSSTSIDQDASSPFAHMGNDPLFGVPIPEVTSVQSSSTVSPNTIVQLDHLIPQHISKWTKDHPLDNVIVEPKSYKDALIQSCWIEAMQEELNEFERLKVWELVPRPDKVMVITLKWIYKVKLDELGGILKNKARLVARGYRQEEGINFKDLSDGCEDHIFNGNLREEVYVSQLDRNGNDLLLVQIYVDDIIFVASIPELCVLFANLMCSKFKMSMKGKISFFLGLQISQSPRGIFINQSKYALESLKKYDFESCDPVDTPMVE
nr:retrovirus-related Pol polyprotein from transposon TNT 1-94 [Tanacetum cinerariifolium]